MAINLPIIVPMTIAEDGARIALGVSESTEALSMSLGVSVNTVAGEHYEGQTEFTPTAERQTISTAGLIMDGDIYVEPIPSNYGLITWNGSYIRVS